MTDRYRMTTDVRAWQVAPNKTIDIPWPVRVQWDGWRIVKPILRPGDWVVETAYGFETFTDEAFRACCTEVTE